MLSVLYSSAPMLQSVALPALAGAGWSTFTSSTSSCLAARSEVPNTRLPTPPELSYSMLQVHKHTTSRTVLQNVDAALERLQKKNSTEYKPLSKKRAAVLIPLVKTADGSLAVLLTQRNPAMRAYPGQVCLPGGKQDPEDADDVGTALREAYEEIGLDPKSVRVLCKLPPVLSCAPGFFSVAPVLGLLPDDFVPKTNPDEVSSVFTMPLHEFLENSPKHQYHDNGIDGVLFRVHYFLHQQWQVWGMTASVLIKAAQAAFEEAPEFTARNEQGLSFSKLAFDGKRIVTEPEFGAAGC